MTEQTDDLLRDVIAQIADMRSSIGSLDASVENLSHDAGTRDAQANQERRDMQITITDIRGEIGEINGRLAVGSERHRDFAKSLDAINVRGDTLQAEVIKISPLVSTVNAMKEGFDKITPLATTVTEMKPQVKELMEFKGRIAAIMLVASSVVGASMVFIWEGFKWFFPNARAFVGGLFH